MADYKVKIKAFLKTLKPRGIEGYITTNVVDMQYFCARPFQPSERSVLLITPKHFMIFARPLAFNAIKESVKEVKVVMAEDISALAAAAEFIIKNKIKNICFDQDKELFSAGQIFQKAGIAPETAVTNAVRMVKNKEEIKNIRKACQIAYNAFLYIKPRIKTGMTELEAASMLENYMKSQGASGVSFDTIMAFGKNSADPHHATNTTKLKSEDVVLVDFGCIYKGYCSDITRTWWHGKKPAAEFTKVWNIVDLARKEGVKKVRPGMSARNADKICRDIIETASYGPLIHSTGHGVGMNLHEAPFLNPPSQEILKTGNIFTIEPGIYIPGKFGVRLEDTVELTAKGANILTKK